MSSSRNDMTVYIWSLPLFSSDAPPGLLTQERHTAVSINWSFFLGVLRIRALLLGSPDVWKLPHNNQGLLRITFCFSAAWEVLLARHVESPSGTLHHAEGCSDSVQLTMYSSTLHLKIQAAMLDQDIR